LVSRFKFPSLPQQGAKPMNDTSDQSSEPKTSGVRVLSPAAQRALVEAEARRAKPAPQRPHEWNGRDGPDPVRYGDWEVKGLACDF
jgi:hypothetical protein